MVWLHKRGKPMTKISRESILSKLQWRYATKKFDAAKKLSSEDWNALEEVLRLAPSSYGLQPWKFLIVQNPELRAELKKASWDQSQVTDCSQFVVFLYRKKVDESWITNFVSLTEKTRGLPAGALTSYREMMLGDLVRGPRAKIIDVWAQRQTYIAMGMLMESAALLDVDTCPMEGLDPAAYDKILGLENSGWATVAACAVGYRAGDDKYQTLKKVRFSREDIIESR